MQTKYYSDAAGKYLGGFAGAEPPEGAIEVPFPPRFAHAIWNGAGYDGDKPTYADARAAEYPPITDYIDAVVKGDQAQLAAYIAACRAVKAKYPKPGD